MYCGVVGRGHIRQAALTIRIKYGRYSTDYVYRKVL